MRTGIFSFRAFDRRLARLAAPISSGVRQGGGRICPPSGARSAEYPSRARVKGGRAHRGPCCWAHWMTGTFAGGRTQFVNLYLLIFILIDHIYILMGPCVHIVFYVGPHSFLSFMGQWGSGPPRPPTGFPALRPTDIGLHEMSISDRNYLSLEISLADHC